MALNITKSYDAQGSQHSACHSIAPPLAIEAEHRNILLCLLKRIHKDDTQSQLDHQLPNEDKTKNQLLDSTDEGDGSPGPPDSDEQMSRQAQYLSYFEVLLPDLESQSESIEFGSSRQKLNGLFRRQFLAIYYQCVIYVRKNELRTSTDDNLLADRLADHIQISSQPKPKSLIGNSLLANGYVLTAYAILYARKNRSPLLLEYVFSQFNMRVAEIEENLEEFLYYSQKDHSEFNIYGEMDRVMDENKISGMAYKLGSSSRSEAFRKGHSSHGLKRRAIKSYEQGQNQDLCNTLQLKQMHETRATHSRRPHLNGLAHCGSPDC